MKKVTALILCLVLLSGLFVTTAAENLKTLSVAQLLTLRSSIEAELMNRSEKESFTVPMGTFIVGEDFPAGTYKVTLGINSPFPMATLITYASEADIAVPDFINMYTISTITGTAEVGKLKLEAGMAIVIDGTPLLFSKYTGLKLN